MKHVFVIETSKLIEEMQMEVDSTEDTSTQQAIVDAIEEVLRAAGHNDVLVCSHVNQETAPLSIPNNG